MILENQNFSESFLMMIFIKLGKALNTEKECVCLNVSSFYVYKKSWNAMAILLYKEAAFLSRSKIWIVFFLFDYSIPKHMLFNLLRKAECETETFV